MIIYEVNLFVDNEIAEEMAVWLRTHLREMLAFDGFVEARWYQLDPADGKQRWVCHYYVERMSQLQDYFDQHAAAMRAEGVKRFGSTFSANRRILYEREVMKA
ncbi:MAG TPA: DUF4286 family protein [Rhodothermales bacterium]|nr:DUF4286 family protein [Rhodothermales bacterium]